MTYIIIPTYNHLEDALKPCVESIIRYTTLSNDTKILVVANGCIKDTQDYLDLTKSTLSYLEYLWTDEPLGYTRACNAGFHYALAQKADFVILLNNDTVILPSEKDAWIKRLLAPFSDERVGIAGVHAKYSEITERDFLIFYCVAIRCKALEEVGLLDEIYSPAGSEDIDFCYRLEDKGYIIQAVDDSPYSPEAGTVVGTFPLYHKANVSLGEIPNWDRVFQSRELILAWKLAGAPLKLNLGCGDMILEDYINCDPYSTYADMRWDAKQIPLPDNSVSEITTMHLIEHFDFMEAFTVLQEWRRVLKPGGKLIIETPDFLVSCKKFVEMPAFERPTLYSHFFSEPWVSPGQIHKFLYTPEQMQWTLEDGGFKNIVKKYAPRYIGREDICMRYECEK